MASSFLRLARSLGQSCLPLAAVSVSAGVLYYSHHFVLDHHSITRSLRAFCEEEPSTTETLNETPKQVVEIIIPDEDDGGKWEEEKKHCSFCRSFINSPCKEPFKKWSKCVDKAKEMENVDFIEACSTYTRGLMKCTEVHEEFFRAMHEQQQKEMAEKEREEQEELQEEEEELEELVGKDAEGNKEEERPEGEGVAKE